LTVVLKSSVSLKFTSTCQFLKKKKIPAVFFCLVETGFC
jgi:hypothetical protein